MNRRRERLDRVMVQRKLADSREKAQALIMAGEVLIQSQKAAKPGQLVHEDIAIEVLSRPRYVSRGGLKLEAAVAAFQVPVENAVCLDIGSSTGGFTDCLLQHGAARVYAIDAGTAQLDWKIRNDPRVRVQENFNARSLLFEDIGELADLAVCDVSFISVTLILPALPSLLKPSGQLVVLIKPQFEVGRGQVGGGGIVREPELHAEACQKVSACARDLGFQTRLMDSPIFGAEGNREFLLHGSRA